MKFLNNSTPPYELTYNDVFLVPSLSTVASRHSVDLTPNDGTPCTIPLVAANMTAVSGKRMAETLARRGGMAIIPQDIPLDVVTNVFAKVAACDTVFETPITVAPTRTVGEVDQLLGKRSHGAAVVLVDNLPVGIVVQSDLSGIDRYTQVGAIMRDDFLMLQDDLTPEAMFNALYEANTPIAPVLNPQGVMRGVITTKSALRATMYKPAVDKNGNLAVGAAVGINGDIAGRTKVLLNGGASVIVVDTAHGHQQKMLDALAIVRSEVGPDFPVVAGNIVTAEGTKDLINAGASIVKVGVGPGAMCTTRMKTGVGRPQFSAVLACAEAAKEAGGAIWADGGVRHPRDVALALAAGAGSVMIGSWLAATHESPGDIYNTIDGKQYKLSYGMASARAVQRRTKGEDPFNQARKAVFEEGISSGKMIIDPVAPGVEDLVDDIMTGVKSSCTYAGAKDLVSFAERAIVGVQSAAGFAEGKALEGGW